MSNLTAVNLDDISLKRCIDYANDVIELCGLHIPRVSSVQEINSSLFVSLFERITDHTVSDVSASKESSRPSSSTDGHNKAVTLVKSSPEDEENISSARELKRKTCRNTLNKCHRIQKNKVDHAVSSPYHSKRNTDASGNLKLHLKRRNSKPLKTVYKRANVEGIEDLYESNFDKKVKALLENEKSPVIHAQEMRRRYIQSLKAPVKGTSIPPCKKSFLLPHNLRPSSKSPVRQHPNRKKNLSKRSRVKSQLYENSRKQSESNVQNGETPASIRSMLNEFPGFQFPENSLELLKKHYFHHISSIHQQLKNTLLKKPTIVKQTEKALKEETKLSKILTKDLQEKDHLKKINEERAIEIRIKASLRDARMQSVKMRQYFEEFHKSMNRKLGKRNFSEEVLIEKTFKEMLDLQKEKVRLLCKRMKEADDYDAMQHRKYLDALKNVYQEQLDLLAESLHTEQKESFEREKAKRLATDKMNREILKTLQKEVRSLQKDVLEMMEDIHFRELDAQNFIKNCQSHNF